MAYILQFASVGRVGRGKFGSTMMKLISNSVLFLFLLSLSFAAQAVDEPISDIARTSSGDKAQAKEEFASRITSDEQFLLQKENEAKEKCNKRLSKLSKLLLGTGAAVAIAAPILGISMDLQVQWQWSQLPEKIEESKNFDEGDDQVENLIFQAWHQLGNTHVEDYVDVGKGPHEKVLKPVGVFPEALEAREKHISELEEYVLKRPGKLDNHEKDLIRYFIAHLKAYKRNLYGMGFLERINMSLNDSKLERDSFDVEKYDRILKLLDK